MKKITDQILLATAIVAWLKSYAENAGLKGFVIGVSGGIDSAVVSTLCAMTGLDLLILEMPIHQASAEVDRARKHIAWLKENYPNVESMEIDLTEAYDAMYKKIGSINFDHSKIEQVGDFDFSMANTRSRLRMATLYQFGGMCKLLVAGTGNKVEDFGIGFYTKYGDGGVDISPIADLLKSEVYTLGNQLGINEEILTAVPTDGLHTDGRTDEDQIGASYDELEYVMCLDDNEPLPMPEGMSDKREIEVIKIYSKLHNMNRHKMIPIPLFDTTGFRGDK